MNTPDIRAIHSWMPKKIVTREEYKVMVRPCGLTEYFLEDARPRLIAISHPDLDQDEERVLISSIEEQGFNIVVVSSYDEQYHYFGGAGDMWRDNYKADYVWLGWPDKKNRVQDIPCP